MSFLAAKYFGLLNYSQIYSLYGLALASGLAIFVHEYSINSEATKSVLQSAPYFCIRSIDDFLTLGRYPKSFPS